jgi:hypothetical protein
MPTRTDEDVRREIEVERERLAHAVESLREGVDVKGKLRKVGAGLLVAGGVGATVRQLLRRRK